jgi:RND family efflux transporter MFP subunit
MKFSLFQRKHIADVKTSLSVLCMMATLTSVAGCLRENPLPKPDARAVKIGTVQGASARTLQLLGTVRQHESATLSFESQGRIAQIDVDVGDSFHRGQVLAALDRAPSNLRLQQAAANVSAATAQFAEWKLQFDQEQALFADHIVSSTALESASAAYQVAHSKVSVTHSNLALARREVSGTAIVAPFDGRVVARAAQPFAEVEQGQTILQVEGRDYLEVVVRVPTTLAAELRPGFHAFAQLHETSSVSTDIVLTHLSDHADNDSRVQAIFQVNGDDAILQSGTIVSVRLPDRASETLPTVPADALLMESTARQAHLFIYDGKSGHVTERKVTLGQMVNGDVQVQSGISVGESIVVAGAPFLADGQAVMVFQPATQLSPR